MTVDQAWLLKGMASMRQHRWCPHSPTPKQKAFLGLPDLEALYGGAAGGGKSDALLMAALQHVDDPAYVGILFRKTFADLNLPGAIMARSHEWLQGTAASWNGRDNRWIFPSGATLAFGYLDAKQDRYRYQGAEFQFVGFDELTQFTEQDYRYLLSRLRRRAGSIVPLRARSASNPGGVGHEWVKQRFLTGEKPFIPAKLDDNPHLDREEYRLALAQLDSVTRRQLEEGIWEQDSEGLMYRAPGSCWVEQPEGITHYVLGLDYGIVNDNAIAVLGWKRHEKTVYALEAYTFAGNPTTVAEEVRKLQASYKLDQIVGDAGGMGKAFIAEAESRYQIPIDPAEKQNKLGYVRLLNGALERGELKVVRGKCADLRREWSSLMRLADGREAPGQPNHASDAVLYAWRACLAYQERERPPVKSGLERLAEETDRAIKSPSGAFEEPDPWE